MTLEEAREAAAEALHDSVFEDEWQHISKNSIVRASVFQQLDAALSAYAAAGYVLCNKTLTMDQRNKMTDVFHTSFQSMQSVHEAMLKGVK